MTPIIYIASPYSHSDKDVVTHRFNTVVTATANLVASGRVAFSPISYGHTLLSYADMPSDWAFWQNFCNTFLFKSDVLVILTIDGWDTSAGVIAEIELAKKHNIRVIYWDGLNIKDFDRLLDETRYLDLDGKVIHIGDVLKSTYGFNVIVHSEVDEDGDIEVYGKLVCDDKHSCRNLKYSISEKYYKIVESNY